jgi:hypothetical protein
VSVEVYEEVGDLSVENAEHIGDLLLENAEEVMAESSQVDYEVSPEDHQKFLSEIQSEFE